MVLNNVKTTQSFTFNMFATEMYSIKLKYIERIWLENKKFDVRAAQMKLYWLHQPLQILSSFMNSE
jgi:hypothetical protein